jgi:hypothetical protein
VIAVRVLVFLIGAVVVLATIASAVRTVILPRGVASRLARTVFISLRIVFRLRARPSAPYEKRDRIMALYGPVSLLALLVTWMVLVLLGFTAMFWTLDQHSLRTAFMESGSSLLTLGFQRPAGLPAVLLVFSEAAIGLTLLALLITYLPSIYSAFSRREALVTALEVRAGSPPTGIRLMRFFFVMEQLDRLTEFWAQWESWFVELEETHTSFPALAFFRSPMPDHSWITATGAVLDGAALLSSTVEVPREQQAEFTIRAGYLALRRLCEFFGIHFNPEPHFPEQDISITREEFDEACDHMVEAGVPLKADREQAWIDFAGWRVNYDTVLIKLAGLTMAPIAPWSSDRGLTDLRLPLIRRRKRGRGHALPAERSSSRP